MKITAPALPVAVALLLAPLAVVLQSKAMAPIALVSLALSIIAFWRQDRALPWPGGAALAMGLALGLWGAISAAWAIEPARALTTGLSLAGMVALAGGAARALDGSDGPTRRTMMLLIAAGLAVGLAAATIDTLTGNAIRAGVRGLREVPATLAFGLKPAGSLMALLLPLAAAFPWPVAPRIAFLLAGAGLLIVLPGDTAKIAAVAGLAAAGAAALWPRVVPRLIGAGLGFKILAMPFLVAAIPALPVERLPPSALHRMLIWDFAAERIAERPLLGWGMEASREIPGGQDQPGAAALDRLRVTDPALRRWFAEPHVHILPLHPHNGALQLWLELGAVGAAIAALLAWFLGVAAARAPSPAAASGALASAAVTAMLSFGAWQAWWVAAMLLVAAVCGALPVRGVTRGPALPGPLPPRA
ncbi:O-antigen ligase family protein [Roseomonas sp. CAU 1739]|uniref:O-antigen ligase family protein n=1 Tax=Roseomonas sp. CAU 1739 TaxID=3140364 RepID=UPI00325A8D70